MSVGAKVTVKFTLEFVDGLGAGGGWGDDCTLGQLRKQAKDSARSAANRVVLAAAEHAGAKLTAEEVGEPWVYFPTKDKVRP